MNKDILPYSVWPSSNLKELEKIASKKNNITSYDLMQRAGLAVYKKICSIWPKTKHWLILVGPGNNGGDGYVVARLAYLASINVTVISSTNNQHLITDHTETNKSRQDWIDTGNKIYNVNAEWPDKIDLIVDALFGYGINRKPDKSCALLIQRANLHHAQKFSIDMPSGLNAATGAPLGEVIHANHTMSLIALKPGQITGKARDYIGKLHFSALGLENYIFNQKTSMERLDSSSIKKFLKTRIPSSHKGNHGKVLVIGGDKGFGGAIRMTAEAALRSGSGIVKVLTHKENISPIITARPELIVQELTNKLLLQKLNWAHVVAIGPGLGTRNISKHVVSEVKKICKPMLWDADALNVLASNKNKCNNRVITPHPIEAARLLEITVQEVENDRVHAAKKLVNIYGGVVVLKGAGTIVVNEVGNISFIDVGNAGMASAGMGDLLSGIIISLIGQNYSLFDAARLGCLVHGAAADAIALNHGMRCMIATDLFKYIRKLLNPEIIN
ncbi:bifunctional ADP-dependent NAD(P)H-hydrate dehydratase/NAD(P)H-hydrate epimerase [Candidatus Ishikawella capsulata]|uniref:Bifunctional NAD(P)H-hydrate repair enzyme n=1 Tax=Candidatus Ishikawaella capsulata Mpkobe TaxID=476281 RepID=C5WCI5_9ENTR|nr:bifunctional ADP-dependent NAD(P)H-hydrate dehydratase/NAD(P)H-hydrate epimerase [Candidatus Ishikawaella capsulata]BAH83041.1 predicted carbohydrate kinase [Candidatus Ishikawaella capsulata Mpkobe]